MISVKSDRTHYIENINRDMIGQEVILGGWVEDLR
jgi:aspartyl-tRNA synthetase